MAKLNVCAGVVLRKRRKDLFLSVLLYRVMQNATSQNLRDLIYEQPQIDKTRLIAFYVLRTIHFKNDFQNTIDEP